MTQAHRSRLAFTSIGAFTALLVFGLAQAPAQGQPANAASHVPIPPGPSDTAGNKLLIIYLRDLPEGSQKQSLDRLIRNVSPEQRQMIDRLLADPAAVEKLRNDPRIMRGVLDAMQDGPSGSRAIQDPEVRRVFDETMKQAQRPQPDPKTGLPPPPVAVGGPQATGQESDAPAPPGPASEQLTAPETPPTDSGPQAGPDSEQEETPGWKQELLDALEELRAEDGPLADSPAWREAMHDLSVAALDSLDAESDRKLSGQDLDRQMSRWSRTIREVNQWTEPARTSLRGLGFSSWSHSRTPRLRWGRVPSLGSPNLAGPSVSGLGTGAVLAWLVLAGALAGIFWQLLVRYQKGATLGEAGAWELGPWPVAPAEVRTRGQLVRAFEYLSLLRLGRAAQSWNHLEIAAKLGGEDARWRQAAVELADIYEHARYAPADEPLADEALAVARRDLCLLAGVATA